MNHKSTTHLLLIGTALIITLGLGGLAQAQVKKGKTRPITTGQLMKGLVKPHCDALKKGFETAPADDKAWAQLAVHAAMMNEGSYLLMDDGGCPDGTWADASTKMMRQGSEEILKAIEAKDLAAAKTAFGTMTKSCKACHDAHKEKH